jgi:hypothetical protein
LTYQKEVFVECSSYFASSPYIAALGQPDARRYTLDGTVIEPVADAHKVPSRQQF